MIEWIRNLVGNGKAATIGIGIFIAILLFLCARCAKADELDARFGASFGHSSGAVLGLQYLHPLPLEGIYFYAGTLLWGATSREANNWDWHGGLRACKGEICANLGACYVQKLDDLNGSHTNFNLELSWAIGWKRVSSIDITHISDAGTSPINTGRQAALVSFRLQ